MVRVPLDPVNSSSSVASTHRTAFEWPSATETHCRGAVRPPFTPPMGLITPLMIRYTHNCQSVFKINQWGWFLSTLSQSLITNMHTKIQIIIPLYSDNTNLNRYREMINCPKHYANMPSLYFLLVFQSPPTQSLQPAFVLEYTNYSISFSPPQSMYNWQAQERSRHCE